MRWDWVELIWQVVLNTQHVVTIKTWQEKKGKLPDMKHKCSICSIILTICSRWKRWKSESLKSVISLLVKLGPKVKIVLTKGTSRTSISTSGYFTEVYLVKCRNSRSQSGGMVKAFIIPNCLGRMEIFSNWLCWFNMIDLTLGSDQPDVIKLMPNISWVFDKNVGDIWWNWTKCSSFTEMRHIWEIPNSLQHYWHKYWNTIYKYAGCTNIPI